MIKIKPPTFMTVAKASVLHGKILMRFVGHMGVICQMFYLLKGCHNNSNVVSNNNKSRLRDINPE